uniref:Bile acid:sodium symporter n=1 Tax=Roseihalotalea indica TaxID=2867963 RepID=A0AA49JGC7_9BACT|nr:bile acid:sodium symporter [Tunicatimonas sp. TK19036]
MNFTFSLSRVPAMLKQFGLDWFILALLGMILLAYLIPGPGAQQGPASLDSIAGYGVSLIFFFYGLRLDGAQIKAGLSNWRLHLIIQSATFLIFPLLVGGLIALLQSGQPEYEYLWLGVFFLAALPSTVSSSVVMVSIARGNIPAAIFNASISSLLGVFITPLWMGLMMQQSSSNEMNLGSVVGKLALQVFLPVVLGILLNPTRLGAFAGRYRKTLKYFDQLIILLIVYTSFSESFEQNMFAGYAVSDLLILGAGLLGLFAVMVMILVGLSIISKFNWEDRITLIFCGSKKSLVHGSVMAKVLFTGSIAGVVLLPVMLYHAMQLIIASILAQSFAQRKKPQPIT